MGMLVNGVWFDDDPLPADGVGRFVRPDSIFRDWVTRDGSSGFKAEAGRYQLVTAPSCPWAHRTVLMRKLKRLDGAIALLESDLPKGEGWAYSRGFEALQLAHQHGAVRPGAGRRGDQLIAAGLGLEAGRAVAADPVAEHRIRPQELPAAAGRRVVVEPSAVDQHAHADLL